jgi:N-acetylglucosaminyldiphosphoundecaprenol N-acetyl-beta-D-mannosaminyltransferase
VSTARLSPIVEHMASPLRSEPMDIDTSLKCDVVPIGPLKISVLSLKQLTQRLIGHTFDTKTQHVVTANAQFYVLAEENEEFKDCVSQAEYVCADGIAIVMACKWLGKCDVARVPGVDLVSDLCKEAAPLGLRVFFLGGKVGTAQRSASIMCDSFRGLQVAGVSCPPIGFLSSPALLEALLEEIKESRPAILFVALGAPNQELFIQRYVRPLGISVAIGVGGSFDIIAGEFRRAPLYIQKVGLEWAFRWAQEPRRLARRYLIGNALFAYYLIRDLIA